MIRKRKIVLVVCCVLFLAVLNYYILKSSHLSNFFSKGYIRVIVCVVVDIFGLYFITQIHDMLIVPKNVYKNRDIIWELSKNDLKSKFSGSYFGITWAFVQPMVMMLLYWFVFQVGLRAGRVSDCPFILFLMSGMIPWFYFSEALGGASNSLVEYNYLVKKVVFDINILPVIKVISALFVHLFFVIFIIAMCAVYGYYPDLYSLQLLYYIICLIFLVLSTSYFFASIVVFFKDMTQIINIILTIGVWITPIMWDAKGSLPTGLLYLFKINPAFYVVDGFRDALIYKSFFYHEKLIWTLYFWIICILIYIAGVKFFEKSKDHFSDVL